MSRNFTQKLIKAKKDLLTIGFSALFVVSGFAQSQRLVISEAFSNASCPPCAAQNPNYHTLLKNNATRIIGVKYQTNFPGFDPMNQQNPAEPEARRQYYGVTGVPQGYMDGQIVTGSNYEGALANFNATNINARYNTPANFDLEISHTLSENLDSAFVTVKLKNTLAATAPNNQMRLHLLLTEREITFPSAPGTNGERNFFNVVRKMIPNQNGTTIANTWAVGDSAEYTFRVEIPSYIYKATEIQFVALVQNNSSRAVFQAGVSTPVALQNYALVESASAGGGLTCATEVTNAKAEIVNLGTRNLTKATVHYQLNGDAPQSFELETDLEQGSKQSIDLPAISITQGGVQTLRVWLSNINESGNDNRIGETSTFFNIAGGVTASLEPETFEDETVPGNFIIDNRGSALGWFQSALAGGFGNSTKSMSVFFWNMPNGRTVDLFTPRYDLSASNANKLNFDVAYTFFTPSAPEPDELNVSYSLDCGVTWTQIYRKVGRDLQTAPPVSNPNANGFFKPTASQWRAESLDLTAIAGATEVIFRFQGVSGFGDNVYVDNIQLEAPNAVNETEFLGHFAISPNPASAQTNVHLAVENAANVSLSVVDLTGRVVYTRDYGVQSGTVSLPIYTDRFETGMYLIQATVGDKTSTRKLSIVK